MADEDQDRNRFTDQRAKDSTRAELKAEKTEGLAALKDAIASLMNLDELKRKVAIPYLDLFPASGGWINGQIFNLVEEKNRVYVERMKELQKNHNLEPAEYLSALFGEFEEPFEVGFRNAERGKEKSENEDSFGNLESLELMKDRAINLGTELTRTLVEFSLLRVFSSKNAKRVKLKNWILWRSCKEDSEVFYLIDFLLNTAEELARETIKNDAANTVEVQDLSKDDISGDGKIEDGMIRGFAKAILGLQSLVQFLQREPGVVPTGNELDRLNREISQCEEHLQVLKAGTNGLEESSEHETNEALRKKVELRICWYWNDRFWKYVSTAKLLSSEIRFPLAVYALSKLFALDSNSSAEKSLSL